MKKSDTGDCTCTEERYGIGTCTAARRWSPATGSPWSRLACREHRRPTPSPTTRAGRSLLAPVAVGQHQHLAAASLQTTPPRAGARSSAIQRGRCSLDAIPRSLRSPRRRFYVKLCVFIFVVLKQC